MSHLFLTFDTPAVEGYGGRYYYTVADHGSARWAFHQSSTKRDQLLDDRNPSLQPAPDFFECLQMQDPKYYHALASAPLGYGKVQRKFKRLLPKHLEKKLEAGGKRADDEVRSPSSDGDRTSSGSSSSVAQRPTGGTPCGNTCNCSVTAAR